MQEQITKPGPALLLAGVALTIIGGLLGWFEVGNELVSDLAEEELNSRQMTTVVIAVIVAALGFGALASKKAIAYAGAVLSAFALLIVFNQLPSTEDAELLDVSTLIGYWMSLLGSLIMLAGSAWIGVKGGESKPEMSGPEEF